VQFNDADPPLPRRGELSLARARALVESGRLRDGLRVLDAVRPTDPEKSEADALRARVQRQLIALELGGTANPSDGVVP
jgi:hypothetical protein